MPPRSLYDIITTYGTDRAYTSRFRPRQKVKLPAELGGATGEVVGSYGPALWEIKVGAYVLVVSEDVLEVAAPQWRPGDVVIVRWHGPTSPPYTYVRGKFRWPGEQRDRTDAQIDELYLAGKAKPVLQSGGEPFDEGRL